MAHRREVRLGQRLLEEAQRLFPPSGSTEGVPTYDRLVTEVLPAVTEAFGRDFEGQLAEHPSSPIRMVLTAQTPFFPEPLVFYAILTEDTTVEIIDVVVDEEFLETWDEDID